MNEELIKAATLGNLKRLIELLHNGADSQFLDGDKAMALHWAALNGHLPVVEALISYSDLEHEDIQGKTPLFYAIKGGHLNIVKYLLDKGANPKQTTNSGSTLLIYAAKYGHTNIVEFLIESGLSEIEEKKNNVTAIFYAAEYAHVETVKYLFSKGLRSGSIHTRMDNPHHALSIAIQNRTNNMDDKALAACYKQIIDILSTKEVLEAASIGYPSPFFMPLHSGDVEVAKLLESKGSDIFKLDEDEYAFQIALKKNLPSDYILHLIKRFLSERSDALKKKNLFDQTLFFESAARGKLDLVRFLIENGQYNFDVNHRGETPLLGFLRNLTSTHSFEECRDLMELLIKNGDSLSSRDNNDIGVLGWLILKNRLAEINYFLEKGLIDLFEKNKRQETLLHIGCRGYHQDSMNTATLKYLLEKGLKPNEVDVDGNTALHYGYGLGSWSDFELLLKTGIKTSQTNRFGETVSFAILTRCAGFRLSGFFPYTVLNKDIMFYLSLYEKFDNNKKYNHKTLLFYIAQSPTQEFISYLSLGIGLDKETIEELKKLEHSRYFPLQENLRCLDIATKLLDYSQGKLDKDPLLTQLYLPENISFANVKDPATGNTALHFALLQPTPNLEFIKRFLTKTNIFSQNAKNQTPIDLMLAHTHPFLRSKGLLCKALEYHQFKGASHILKKTKEEESKAEHEFQSYILKTKECCDRLKGEERNEAIFSIGMFLTQINPLEGYEFLKKIPKTDSRYKLANAQICRLKMSGKLDLESTDFIKHLLYSNPDADFIKKGLSEYFEKNPDMDLKNLNFTSFDKEDACLDLINKLKQQEYKLQAEQEAQKVNLTEQGASLKKYETELLKLRNELGEVKYKMDMTDITTSHESSSSSASSSSSSSSSSSVSANTRSTNPNKRLKTQDDKNQFERNAENSDEIEIQDPTSSSANRKRKIGS